MNYNSNLNQTTFAQFSEAPPYYSKESSSYYDRGAGIPQLDQTNLTYQDIYRTPFLFIQEHRNNYRNIANTALKGIQTNSKLSDLYFSDKNIKEIQRLIRLEVFKRTNGQFRLDVDQKLDDVLIVMRAIYMEYARYLPGQTKVQVQKLNMKLIDEIVPGIITEVKQYYGYLKEINKPLTPIARPLNVNNKGRKSLPSVTTTW